MFEAIKNIDYIIDYYAILEIDRNSSKEDIQKGLRKRRAEWHPDALQGRAEEVKNKAPHKMALFQEAQDVLLNEKLKPIYDGRLAGFEEHLISKDGHAIIDATRQRIDLDFLLSDAEADFSVIIEKTKLLLGYDEKQLKTIKTLYDSDKNNSIFKDLYKKKLIDKLILFSQLEGTAWLEAGVMTQQPARKYIAHINEYCGTVDEHINAIKEKAIPDNIETRLLAYDMGTTPLLSYDGQDNVSEDQVSTEVRSRIIMNFNGRCDKIREIAEQKEEVLEELLSLTDYEYLKKKHPSTKYFNVFLISKEQDIALLGYRFDSESPTPTELNDKFKGLPLEELKNLPHNEDTILVDHNSDLSQPIAEIIYVAEQHINK